MTRHCEIMDVVPYLARFAHQEALKGEPLTYLGRYVTASMEGIARRMQKREVPDASLSWNKVGGVCMASFFVASRSAPSLTLLWGALSVIRRRDHQTYIVADVTPRKGGIQKSGLVASFDLSGKDVLICLLSDYPAKPDEKLRTGINKILAYTRGKLIV